MISIFIEEWERCILRSIFGHSDTEVWKRSRTNDLFLCRHYHSEGEGLIEIFAYNAKATGLLAFQLSVRGDVLGILKIQPDGRERIVFDRGEGLGDEIWAEEQKLNLFRQLAQVVMDEELAAVRRNFGPTPMR